MERKDFEAKKISKVLNFLGRISGILEIVLLFMFIPSFNSVGSWYWVFYALPLWLIWVNGKYELKNFLSKGNIRQTEKDFLVEGSEGKQGSGKTSLVACRLSLKNNRTNNKVITNIPMRINGKFTYKVTPKMLNLEERIPNGADVFFDEMVLAYNNKNKKLEFENMQSLAYLFQMYRQFVIGGNFYGASVSMSRLPKMLRDNFSAYRYMDGLSIIKNSYIIAPILKLIGKILKYDFSYGFFVWRTFLIRDIDHENYNFDLSGLENRKNTPTSTKWAYAEVLVAYNNKGRFDYDDKFMHNIYKKLPLAKLEQYTSLRFDEVDLRNNGYGEFLDFFDTKLVRAKIIAEKHLNIDKETGEVLESKNDDE
jgi:hypothetical protein